jgi:type IV secretory pathway VirB9-like protein
LIELPKGEEIMDVTCGNKTFWAVNSSRNFAFIKPLGERTNGQTNINLITIAGNVYSLLVKEVSTSTTERADLKVLLDQQEETAKDNINHPQYVRAEEVEALRKSLEKRTEELAQTKRTASIGEVRQIRHDYRWKEGKESEVFGLNAIYHDDKYTYIEANSQNAPSVYEVIDGKESLVPFTLENGKYIVTRIMDHGYLRAGKTKLEFKRERETV